MALNTPRITDSASLDMVYQALEDNKEVLSANKDPLVNEQLRMLLEGLYEIEDKMSPNALLNRPSIIAMDSLSNAALISLLMTEIRNTNNLIAVATEIQIKNQQKGIQSKNDDMLEKLKESNEAAKEADDLSDGLDIFKWAMLALSILLVIASIVATICTFGAAAKTIVFAVVVLSISIAMTTVTSVPVDDDMNSAMDLASQSMAEDIAAIAKENLLDDYAEKHGISRSDISGDKQTEILAEAEETGTYSALAIMLTLQIIIAVAMIALSAGAASGAAASHTVNATANSGAQVSQSAISSALAAAKETIKANMAAILPMVKNIQTAGQITSAVGSLGASGATAAETYYTYESETKEADTTRIKALVKLLSSQNEMLLDLIQQLNASTATSWENVAQVLKAKHDMNRKIALQSDGAAFA